MDTWIAELRRVPILSDCSRPELEAVAQHFELTRFPSGATLIAEGSSNSIFAVLLEGHVDVRVAGDFRRTLGPGDFFGEISLETGRRASASVIARSPVSALVMNAQQYQAMRANPVLAHRLARSISERTTADQSALTASSIDFTVAADARCSNSRMNTSPDGSA